jgi:hypothetical protein
VGYFDEAVYKTEQMAQISGAKVVSYEEQLTFWSLMGAQSNAKINFEAEILEKLAAPRLLYLWDGKR